MCVQAIGSKQTCQAPALAPQQELAFAMSCRAQMPDNSVAAGANDDTAIPQTPSKIVGALHLYDPTMLAWLNASTPMSIGLTSSFYSMPSEALLIPMLSQVTEGPQAVHASATGQRATLPEDQQQQVASLAMSEQGTPARPQQAAATPDVSEQTGFAASVCAAVAAPVQAGLVLTRQTDHAMSTQATLMPVQATPSATMKGSISARAQHTAWSGLTTPASTATHTDR